MCYLLQKYLEHYALLLQLLHAACHAECCEAGHIMHLLYVSQAWWNLSLFCALNSSVRKNEMFVCSNKVLRGMVHIQERSNIYPPQDSLKIKCPFEWPKFQVAQFTQNIIEVKWPFVSLYSFQSECRKEREFFQACVLSTFFITCVWDLTRCRLFSVYFRHVLLVPPALVLSFL